MDFCLCSSSKRVSLQINIFTKVIRFVDTTGKHRDLMRQDITSFSHQLAGIRAFTKMNLKNIHPSAIVRGSINGQRHSMYHPLFCGSRIH